MHIKLIVTKRSDDIHVALEGHPSIWESGRTTAEAIGKWILNNGPIYGVQAVLPEGATTPPDVSASALSEDDLFAFANRRNGRPMTGNEREWCLQEIASVEGYERKAYETCDNRQLAQGVLSAWVDFARDKGVL